MATTIGMGAKKNSAKEDNKELKKAKSQIAELEKENEGLKTKIAELEKERASK